MVVFDLKKFKLILFRENSTLGGVKWYLYKTVLINEWIKSIELNLNWTVRHVLKLLPLQWYSGTVLVFVSLSRKNWMFVSCKLQGKKRARLKHIATITSPAPLRQEELCETLGTTYKCFILCISETKANVLLGSHLFCIYLIC